MGWEPKPWPIWCGLSQTSFEAEAQLSSGGPSRRDRKNRAGEWEGLFEPQLDGGRQNLRNPLGR
jgi:hypothetical protein